MQLLKSIYIIYIKIFYNQKRCTMNIFKKIYCRSFQTVFKIALPFLPYRKPKIVSALSDIPSVLNKKKK